MTDATPTWGTRLLRLSLGMWRYISASLLGPFEASLDERPLHKFRTNKVQALLIYLATEASVLHRHDGLMALLWPGLPQKSAQVNLRQTLYRLHQAIPEVTARDGEGTVPFLLVDAGEVAHELLAELRQLGWG